MVVVNGACERRCAYVLIVAAVNFLNENLHWFCGKRTFIIGGLYMSCNGGGGSLVTPSLPT